MQIEAAPLRERNNDDLNTPAFAFLPLIEALGPIALDPCSNPWSQVPARICLDGSSPEQDGLERSWFALAGCGLVFVNPPYGAGHPLKWARKVATEAAMGCEIACLVKGDFSTEAWRTLLGGAAAIAYFRHRIGFEGGKHPNGTFASAMFFYGRRFRALRFAAAMDHLADVRLL